MKFQYKVVSIPMSQINPTNVENGLNNKGVDGWELMTVLIAGTNAVFIMKKLIAS